ncbi:Transporter, drug/metabolite exporter [Bibersteinia trehalosi USDA-ARS-USMARC-188]|uniref:Transporter, drug/metabolite exporter n=1 Tax=Bibersteinia trehalosi USDA-ARS-USMARC-188 TaxID=1263829 RepID=A0A4V7I807_BIBTR|nr:DMT family transporter [Bibersteinia trehalosi]AHG81129.1 Transporter, drug/metabolite exporter [Bibersteinia trehalosi USDA-ARS-USMARC-188]
MWIWFTLLAATAQAGRNAFQKQLSVNVPVLGVTLARFFYAVPLATGYLLFLYIQTPSQPLPYFSLYFFIYVFGASFAQILATALMVQLFQLKNYAIGVGLAKSEAVIAAILGVLFFGVKISILGWLGVVIGGIAIFLMTGSGNLRQLSWKTLYLGVASGLCFALTSLWVREASLQLQSHYLISAAWVLFAVITLEAVGLTLYLAIRQPQTLRQFFRYPKLGMLTSLFSFLGSFGWFNAMSLNHVAFVKTLGQVEIFFILAISYFIFKERLKIQDFAGLILVVLAAILVVLH